MTDIQKKKKYLQICRIFDVINKKANFCNIRVENEVTICDGIFKDKDELCCSGCEHLSKTGCTVDSIMCKISFCFMNTGPTNCNLIKTEEQKIMAQRRFSIMNFVFDYMEKNNIPHYSERASMEQQFELKKTNNIQL